MLSFAVFAALSKTQRLLLLPTSIASSLLSALNRPRAGRTLCAALILLACRAEAQDSPRFEILKAFSNLSRFVDVVQGADGALYALTRFGGVHNGGTVVRVPTDGSAPRVILNLPEWRHFETDRGFVRGSTGMLYVGAVDEDMVLRIYGIPLDGTPPIVLYSLEHSRGGVPAIIQASDGYLYASLGSVGLLKIAPDGSDPQLTNVVGVPPIGFLEGKDGLLYGAIGSKVVRFQKNGAGYTVLHDLPSTQGGHILDLFQASDGWLYGATEAPATSSTSFLFRLDPRTLAYQRLPGAPPGACGRGGPDLVESAASSLLWTCVDTSTQPERGRIYEYTPANGAVAPVATLTPGQGYPAALTVGSDGTVYGVTRTGGPMRVGTVFRLEGTSATVVFATGEADMGAPVGPMTLHEGTVLGVTTSGRGSVFSVGKDGTVELRLEFPTSGTGPDGPLGGLVPWGGALYGASYLGGSNNRGSIFSLSGDELALTVIQSSSVSPRTPLVGAGDGTFYGFAGQSTLYRVDSGGDLTPLTSFAPGIGVGSFLLATNGFLYGVSSSGLFRVAPDGTGLSVLGTDGSHLAFDGNLVETPDGTLIGTRRSLWPDTDPRSGCVFSIRPDLTGYMDLHAFAEPQGPYTLTRADSGLLYGTSGVIFGMEGHGHLFRLSPGGRRYEVLHRFTGLDGHDPRTLVEVEEGVLVGTTRSGGPLGGGVVFRITDDADRDGDGWPDRLDNCPEIPNPKQVDRDRDEIGDGCALPIQPCLDCREREDF